MSDRIRVLLATFLLFVSQGNTFAAEKEPNEPNGLLGLVKDDKWGEPNNGLVTQLIPQSAEYVVGKPMKFGLVLKNISDSAKQYNRQVIASLKPLTVKTPDNNIPYDKIGPYSTQAMTDGFIDASQVVILFENHDITEEFVILKPGKYTIQYPGPPSDIIEIEVKPGVPDERDLLIISLLDILPDSKWHIVAPKWRRDTSEGEKAVVLSHGFKERDSAAAILWLTKSSEKIFKQRQFVTINEYLGKNSSGYFYIEIQPKALEYWPTIKEDIKKALKIEDQSEQKP